MANNTTLNAVTGTPGDAITDLDLTTFTAYPTTGKLPAVCIYVGPSTAAAPTPLSTANPLPVSGTFWQATQPVSGTVAATQSGTWTARVAGNAGAALDAAGQNAASPANSLLVAAQFNTTPTTLASGNMSPLQMDAAGNLLVNVKAGGGAGGTSSAFGSAFPSTGTAIGARDSTGVNLAALNLDASGFLKVNVAAGGGSGGTSSSFAAALPATGTAAGYSDGTSMQAARVFDADSGAGTQYVAGVVLRGSASGGSVEIGTGTNPVRTDPTGTTTQPVSGTITANAGTNTSTAALALEAGGHLASVDGKLPALGQALAAASVPVVLTAAQLTTLTPAATVAVTQATAANLNATVVGTGTFATQPTIQAGTNLIGKVSSGLDTSTINNGTTALTPRFAAISTAASGVSTVVAAVASKKIRVLSYRFQADADVSVKFRDNTAAVDLTGAVATGARGGGGGASFSPVGHFETAAGNALSINLSGAVQVSGHLTYVEV